MVRYSPGIYERLEAAGKIGPGSMPITGIPSYMPSLSRGTNSDMTQQQFLERSPMMSFEEFKTKVLTTALLAPGTTPQQAYEQYKENYTSPLTNIGIGSLNQTDNNTFSQIAGVSPITAQSNIASQTGISGSSILSSPYMNQNQGLDQYLNSYVNDMVNRRMQDIFGGIMSLFQ